MPKTPEELAIDAKLKEKGLIVKEGETDEEGEEVSEETEEVSEEVEVEDEESTEEVDSDEAEWSEEELQAMDSGWKPQDEWDGDPDDWVTAKQFNRNGEYLRKIHNQNRKIKQLDDVVGNLAKQQKQIFDAGYAKAKRELKSALREANKEGDDATADAIENRIEQLETQHQADVKVIDPATTQQVPPEVAPEFVSWVKRNEWFVKKPALRAFAESVGLAHAHGNPEKTNVEIYQYVTDEVKKRFPEEFGQVMTPMKKKTGSPVVGGSDLTGGTRGSSSEITRVSLSSEEKEVGRVLVDKGIYKNMNEYATDLKKFGVKSK